MSKDPTQLIVAIGIAFLGLFCLWHARRNSAWFFENSETAFLVSLLGRDGARWFYVGLGFFFLLMGLTLALSWLYEPS